MTQPLSPVTELQAYYNDLLALQDQGDQVPLAKALDAVGLALSVVAQQQQPSDPEAVKDAATNVKQGIFELVAAGAQIPLALHKAAHALHYAAAECPVAPAQCAPWQPIETAPKDGTRILVGMKDRFPKNTYVARWLKDVWSIGPLGGEWHAYPTHWMPIPALTSTEREGCPVCIGSGYSSHPDSGEVCHVCNGQGEVTSTERVGGLFPDVGEQEPETILDDDDAPLPSTERPDAAELLKELFEFCGQWNDFRQDSSLARRVRSALTRPDGGP